MKDKEKSTCIQTICRLLLKELRQEQNVQQAFISQLLGRAPSSWSKVESGDTPLSLDHLLTACHAFNVWPSTLLATAQDYMILLERNGWYVATHGAPLSKEDDLLAQITDEYYATNPSQRYPYGILETPWPSPRKYAPLNVFQLAIHDDLKDEDEN